MTRSGSDRNGKGRLLPVLAGLFFIAWAVAVSFAVRDTFFSERQADDRNEGGTILSLPDSGKGRFPILDRGGRELAVSFPSKSVYARPLEVEHPDAVALFLARELGVSEQKLKRDLREERSFVWLGRHVSETAVNSIRARKLRGIYVVDESQRFYPQGGMAAQLLGVAREGRGLTGIEAVYDQQLQTTTDLPAESTQPGGILLLTLDLRIQELLENELAQLAGETGATGGEGIVLDPRSGEVLALANLPAFEPNFFGDSDENSRTNRALKLALPASGFGQLFRLAASSQPLQIEAPAIPVASPPKRDRLAALRKELRKSKPVGTFGGGSNRLIPFEGGYRSPGLAALMKITEPPGFPGFMSGLGFGRKVVMEMEVGVVGKVATGERPPTFQATGGELMTALARLLNPGEVAEPHVVIGIADPQSGRIQGRSTIQAAGTAGEASQRVLDYLGRLAGASGGGVYLEEFTEMPSRGKEGNPVEGAVDEGAPESLLTTEAGREANPVRPGSPVPGGIAKPGAIVQEKPGPNSGAPAGDQDPGVQPPPEGPKRFVSLLVALPGGDGTGVLLLLALEGAALDPFAPSPLRLAAERMLPQIRIWAAENIAPPASVSWSANESLWQAQWQKALADRNGRSLLASRGSRRQMPDLRGASLRKALQVLNQYDLRVRVRVEGVGRVVEQRPEAGMAISDGECVLVLSGLNLINERPARQLAVGVESGSDKLKIISQVSNPRPVGGN